MRSALSFALLCATAFAAPVPKELKKAPKLEGEWEMIGRHAGGKEVASSFALWRIDEKNIFIFFAGDVEGKPTYTSIIHSIDLQSKPMTLDYTNHAGLYRKAIVFLEADKLTLCISFDTPANRPAAFGAANADTYVYKRVK